VINTGPGRRVVLIADVLRPMPRAQHLANVLFASITRLAYGRVLLRRVQQQVARAAAA